MRIIRAAGLRPVPWKNGGGETREIAVFPADAGVGAFDWRVSMATVASDGPFSLFPGIDRTLTVLEGGLRLAVAGMDAVTLLAGDAPFAFPGDADAASSPTGGPATDLNVMTRRGRFTHRVRRMEGAVHMALSGEACFVLIVCLRDPLPLATAGGEVVLQRHDTVLFDGASAALRLDQAALIVEVIGAPASSGRAA